MKLVVRLLITLCLFSILAGCGEEPPYKLSYMVRPRDERILAQESPIFSNTEMAIFVESLDGDSTLKSCHTVFRDLSTGLLFGKPDRCWVIEDGKLRGWADNLDIPLPKGTPVNIGFNYKPNIFSSAPDHFILKTDKGEFTLKVDPKEYNKLFEEYLVEEGKASEQAQARRFK